MLEESPAMSSFAAYLRSDYTVLAVGGGWMDQPEAWKRDIETLMHEYGLIFDVESKKNRRQRPGGIKFSEE